MSIKVLLTFLTGMLPGRSFVNLANQIGVSRVLEMVSGREYIAIVLGVVLVCFFLYQTKPFRQSWLLYGGLILAAILACALHAVTVQYIEWISYGGTYAYDDRAI